MYPDEKTWFLVKNGVTGNNGNYWKIDLYTGVHCVVILNQLDIMSLKVYVAVLILIFYLKHLIFMYMNVLPTCILSVPLHVILWRLEESIGSSGTRLIDSC